MRNFVTGMVLRVQLAELYWNTHTSVICPSKLHRGDQLAQLAKIDEIDEVATPYGYNVCRDLLPCSLVVPSNKHSRLSLLPGIRIGHRSLVLERLEDVSNSNDIPMPARWLDIHNYLCPSKNDQQPPDTTIGGRVPKMLFHASIRRIGGKGWGGEGILDEGVEVESACEEPQRIRTRFEGGIGDHDIRGPSPRSRRQRGIPRSAEPAVLRQEYRHLVAYVRQIN